MQGKIGEMEKTRKENHTTKVTKIPKTKRQKFGMKEALKRLFQIFVGFVTLQ